MLVRDRSRGRRALVGAILVASLLSACASPPEEVGTAPPLDPPSSMSPSAAPEPDAAAPGESRVPASCAELIPASQARLDLSFESRDRPSIGDVIGVTAGLLACERGPVAPGFAVSVYVLAVPPSGWQARLRDAGASESNGVLIERICTPGSSFCGARLSTDAYAAELFVTDYAATGTIGSELDALAAELAETLASMPDPGERSSLTDQRLRLPEDCMSVDIADTPIAQEIAPLLANRELYPGSDDGPLLYYAAERRVGAQWCVWRDGSDDIELRLVPGGGWAVDEPGAMIPGAALDVEGADAARWADSPLEDETVIIIARVGDDLAMLTLTDSTVDGTIADDPVDLAERVLEAFLGSLLDVP